MNRVTLQHIDQYVRYRERHQQRTKGTGILTALKRIVKIVRTADTTSSGIDQDKRTPVEVIVDEYDRYLLQDRGLVADRLLNVAQPVRNLLDALQVVNPTAAGVRSSLHKRLRLKAKLLEDNLASRITVGINSGNFSLIAIVETHGRQTPSVQRSFDLR